MVENSQPDYDLVIVGAGVSGAAQFFAAARYTDIKRVLLIEKESGPGQINSYARSNSQTLHEGDIETNYNFEKAKALQYKAGFTRHYVLQKNDQTLCLRGPKMVLGVGKREYDFLQDRFDSIKELYPTLKQMESPELRVHEPNIFKGRNETEKVMALYNQDGLTVDYGKLAEHLVIDAEKIFASEPNRTGEARFDTKVSAVASKNDFHTLSLSDGTVVNTRYISFCTGSHSMYFAKRMNVADVKDITLLCIAGNFYYTPKYVNAKIYTVQNPKLPFSAVHADPDILHEDKNRFGPTTRIVFMLERHRWNTISEYFTTLNPFLRSLFAYVRIMLDPAFLAYAFRHNVLLILPFVGNYLYLKEIRKIIPTIQYSELKPARGQGGVRPQIVQTTEKSPLNLGEAKLVGKQSRFNITPSPGASTCVYNGLVDVRAIASDMGRHFYASKVERDFGCDLT